MSRKIIINSSYFRGERYIFDWEIKTIWIPKKTILEKRFEIKYHDNVAVNFFLRSFLINGMYKIEINLFIFVMDNA